MDMTGLKLGILKGFHNSEYSNYIKACEHLNIEYELIDFLDSNWIRRIKESKCDGFLCHPPNDDQTRKSIYDEKIYMIQEELDFPCYPNFNEVYIYENKRNMAAWLEIHGFPHAKTYVFSRKDQAKKFLTNASYPLIFKTNSGSGASGVDIIKSKSKALRITNRLFGHFHSALTFGRLRFSTKLGFPLPLFGRIEKHYLLAQEFHKIKWEWRMVKIGDSYFGHKKLLKGDFASGSGQTELASPPKELLYLLKNVCDTGKFNTMNVDILETKEGHYLINEMQAMFGSYNDVQMRVNGKPGRYIYKDNDFHFEEGVFNQFGSCLLRVQDFVTKLNEGFYD